MGNRISSWHSTAKAYVMRVKSQFDCCVANKKTKTCTYTSNLVAKIAAQKLQLENRLKCMADQHKLQYDRFHTCAFGVDTKYDILKSEYKDVLTRRSKLSLRNSKTSGKSGNQNSKNISSVATSVPLELQLHVETLLQLELLCSIDQLLQVLLD